MLSELCLASHWGADDAHVQLIPLAPNEAANGECGSGGAGSSSSSTGQAAGIPGTASEQLKEYHWRLLEAAMGLGLAPAPAATAAVDLSQAAAMCPGRLRCLERSPPERDQRVGLFALVREAQPS